MLVNKEDKYPEHILFYDGVCALCNSAVKWLIRTDKNQRIRFAPLQGTTANEILSEEQLRDLKSVLFYSNRQTFSRAEAFFEILKVIGGWQKVFLVFSIFPLSWCNWVYDGIARKRYQWFGKYDTCPMPDPALRHLFLE